MVHNMLVSVISSRVRVTFSSLKHNDFRNFWFGQCISLIGTWIQRSAQVWLVYKMTDSPFLLGLLGVAQFMPTILFSLIAGVFVDRFPKKTLVYFTQASFMLQAFILTYIVYTDKAQYWHILLLAAIYGVLETIDLPARQSWFISMVGKEDLPNAISLNSTILNTGRILGPIVAGFIMAKYGVEFCFLINGITYIAVFIVLFFIKERGEPQKKVKKFFMVEIREGLIHIMGSLTLRITILIMAIFCIFAVNVSVIIPVFANDVLLRGVNGYTTLLSATGIGSLLGAIYMANRRGRVQTRLIIQGAILISFVHIIAAYTKIYSLSIFLMCMVGFFSITTLNMVNSVLQLYTKDVYRGRVMSIYVLVSHGSHPLGYIFVGFVMERYGAAMGFISCGVMVLSLTGLLFLLTPMQQYLACGEGSPINSRD